MKYFINFKKRKPVLITVIVFLFLSVTVSIYALNSWNTGFRINTEVKSIFIDSTQICYRTTNLSSNPYFIPTKTIAEWNSFNNNKPSGVSVGACCIGSCCGSACTFSGPTEVDDTGVQVCTGNVSQAACYSNPPTPTLNWSYSGNGGQGYYWIQIDDNSNYSSLLVDTGWVSSSGARSYVVPSGLLNFNTTYYWRIGLRSNTGAETGWANGDSFVTVSICN